MESKLKYIQSIPANKGRVTENPSEFYRLQDRCYQLVGDFFDVLCVANGKKPCAISNVTAYGKIKHRKNDKELINYIIAYCDSLEVNAIHKNDIKSQNTIFFLHENYNKALILANILWYPTSNLPFSEITHYVLESIIGTMLGYDENNIEYFVKIRFNVQRITDEDRIKVINIINNINMKPLVNTLELDKTVVFKDIIDLMNHHSLL